MVLCRDFLHHCELIRPHAACSNIVDFTHLHEIVQRFHCLLDWCMRIESVYLKQVQVIGVQSLQAGIHSAENGCPRKTSLVHVVLRLSNPLSIHDAPDVRCFAYVAVTLGQDDELVAWDVEFLDCLGDYLFADAIGVDLRKQSASPRQYNNFHLH